MAIIPHVKKKIGPSYLVWFQNSNMFIQLEEPAWFVFSKIVKRYRTKTIAGEFSQRYGTGYEESHAFVHEIRFRVENMNKKNAYGMMEGNDGKINEYLFTPCSVYRYQIGNKEILFSYESTYFEEYIHPLISHFERAGENMQIPHFELFDYNGKIVFRFNGQVKGIWNDDETQFVKGSIFVSMINVLFDKTDEDWLMTVHASAITNGRKTILFTAQPGNGKTTMAAMLMANGYKLISDDFVPLDGVFNAYPFPIAMSIKEGSMDLLTSWYPELKKKELVKITPEKSVRYLAPFSGADVNTSIFKVHEFVFIEYNPLEDFNLEILDPFKGIQLLFDQAWVVPTKQNAQLLLQGISKLTFYKLRYSNNQKAIEAINNLFENEK